MIDRILLREKIKSILQYIDEVKPVAALPFSAFAKDVKSLRLAERDFQLIVDAAADIVNHILLENGSPPPPSYYETFLQAGRENILPSKLADALAPAAGLRNRLVHEYEKIDPRKFYRSLKHFLPLFKTFCKAIHERIEE